MRLVRDGIVIAFADYSGWVSPGTDFITDFDPAPSVESARVFPSLHAAVCWIHHFGGDRPFLLYWRSVALARQDQEDAQYLASRKDRVLYFLGDRYDTETETESET